jgi:hypothetical protein
VGTLREWLVTITRGSLGRRGSPTTPEATGPGEVGVACRLVIPVIPVIPVVRAIPVTAGALGMPRRFGLGGPLPPGRPRPLQGRAGLASMIVALRRRRRGRDQMIGGAEEPDGQQLARSPTRTASLNDSAPFAAKVVADARWNWRPQLHRPARDAAGFDFLEPLATHRRMAVTQVRRACCHPKSDDLAAPSTVLHPLSLGAARRPRRGVAERSPTASPRVRPRAAAAAEDVTPETNPPASAAPFHAWQARAWTRAPFGRDHRSSIIAGRRRTVAAIGPVMLHPEPEGGVRP